MRLDNTARTFDSNATFENKAFTIAASAKAFQVLSDQLYNDKPLAILRELGANAYDAHVANGNPEVPFEVHLPTSLNPELILKDFGTGLAPIMVNTLYTTYFGSDKNETNELIGGLGLGSKSPFSYTDQFTVISRHGGVATTYLAYIDDTGIPAITEVSSEPMQPGELTGMTITLPIKDSDHAAFQRAAVKALNYIKTTPKINRDVDLTVEHTDTVLTFDDITMKIRVADKTDDYYMQRYMSSGMRIIMGGVAYPVEFAKFTTNRHSSLAQKRLDIFAPIGWVDFVASREGLAYTKSTMAKLMGLMDRIDTELESNLRDLIDDATNLAEATQIRNDFYQTLGMQNVDLKWGEFDVSGKVRIRRDFPGKIRLISRPWREGGKRKFETKFEQGMRVEWDPKAILMWRPRETPLHTYFQQNPPERGRPYVLFTGSEKDVKEFFADTGLMPEEMPAQPKRKKGVRAKMDTTRQYPARILLTLGDEKHDLEYLLSREDVAQAITETDTHVFLAPQRSNAADLVLEYDSRLHGKDIIFVDIPEHHSRIIQTLVDLGAQNTRGKFAYRLGNLLPKDRDRLTADLTTEETVRMLDPTNSINNAASSISHHASHNMPDDMKEVVSLNEMIAEGKQRMTRNTGYMPKLVIQSLVDYNEVRTIAADLNSWFVSMTNALKTKYAPFNFNGSYYMTDTQKAAMFDAFITQCNNKEHATE